MWAEKLVQGTKTKGLFCPRSPPGQLVTGAAGELRASERGMRGRGRVSVTEREREKTQGESITEQECVDTSEEAIQH